MECNNIEVECIFDDNGVEINKLIIDILNSYLNI